MNIEDLNEEEVKEMEEFYVDPFYNPNEDDYSLKDFVKDYVKRCDNCGNLICTDYHENLKEIEYQRKKARVCDECFSEILNLIEEENDTSNSEEDRHENYRLGIIEMG